jgi:hypothetical protein
MKKIFNAILTAILLAAPAANAQLNPQPPAAGAAAPCVPAPVPLPKHGPLGSIHLPGGARGPFTKACAKWGICPNDPNLPVALPKPEIKPCPAPTAPPVTAPATAAATPANNNKTMLVCPPNTTKIEGYSYCMKPDHTLVDAIQIPSPSLSNPAPPIKEAVPGPAQK